MSEGNCKKFRWLKILSISLIILGLLLLIYGSFVYPILINEPIKPYGRYMVSYEVNIIPGYVYMKPITITVIILFLAFILGLEYLDLNGGITSNSTILFLIISSSLCVFVGFYETLFNFILWSSLISSIAKNGVVHGNIDVLVNTFPNPNEPWNLVYATKIFSLILFIGIFTFIFAYKWSRKVT